MSDTVDWPKGGLRMLLLAGGALCLQACGGGGGPGPATVSSVPPPVVTPTPTPTIVYDTAEYRRSDAAVSSRAIAAWQAGASGAGVTVAFIDSGVDLTNVEFAGRISTLSRDVTSAGRSAQDSSGHGTAVVGVAAAGRNDSGTMGIAWGATIAMFRADSGNCADGCNFSDSAIAAGLDAAVSAGARVVNISLGGSNGNTQLRNAFARAAAAGTILVVSAGNDAGAQVDPLPLAALASGGAAAVIVAGSSNAQGAISDFTNRAGTAQNNYLLALGEDVRSFNHQGQAYYYSGSSFSAPAVTGAVALLAQAFPNLTSGRIVEILLRTADDVGASGTDAVTGRGLLNIERAMQPIGQTSLAGTAIAVPTGASGSLGSAMGDGLSTGSGMRGVPITDGYGRAYTLELGGTMRSAATGRLAGRLQAAGLETAATGSRAGGLYAAMELRATPFRDEPGQDSFRNSDTGVAHLGFAQRGVDANAGARNPLRETRLSLRSGAMGLTAATGRLATESLPGSASAGFVADDGLSPDEATGTDGRQMLMVDSRIDTGIGPLTLALAASSRNVALPPTLGLMKSARQDQLMLAASWAAGPASVAVHAADTTDDGALLGTRLDPAFGLLGGRTQALGGSFELGAGGFGLRLAGTQGWVSPRLAAAGLLRADGLLVTRSWSATARAPVQGGQLSFRLAQPLAVTSGRFLLANGTPLSAAVTATETAAEVGFDRGDFSLAAFHRQDAGNIRGRTDTGTAVTFRTRF
ncbi:S8 family peptidase [Sandaracinobacteroides hominis]|uniref:S8 family peptidase n=1 Tax=Sandaracinobacteroides hominis TaxID=2780086 RepID=UPI0018F46B24|nr:S8 family peptidase [Sandaracinobacteroides hominis]